MNTRMAASVLRKEDDLRAPVSRLFPLEKYLVRSEVPFGLKRIDLVFKQRGNEGKMVAVELKLSKWRKAVWQALVNRQVATYCYLALPSDRAAVVDIGLLRSLGLGLILAGPKQANVALRPKKSPYVNRRLAQRILTLFDGPENV